MFSFDTDVEACNNFLQEAGFASPGPRFNILRGNELALFRLDVQTGQLTVGRPLAPGSVELMVSDQIGAQSCLSRVLIEIADGRNLVSQNPVFKS